MNTQRMIIVSAVAATLAFVSPTYAGILGGGGAGGAFGGGLGGGLNGMGGRGFSGTGMLGSQGSVNGALPSANTKPVTKTVGKVDNKVADTTPSEKDAASNVATAAEGKATSTGATAMKGPGTAGMALQDSASQAPSTSNMPAAPSAKPATPNTPVANSAPAMAPTSPKSAQSSGLTESHTPTSDAGQHAFAGNGSVDAQHAQGSSSLSGNGSASMH